MYKQVVALLSSSSSNQFSFRRATADNQITLLKWSLKYWKIDADPVSSCSDVIVILSYNPI